MCTLIAYVYMNFRLNFRRYKKTVFVENVPLIFI